MPFGVQSRSERHHSDLDRPRAEEGGPVVVLGTPRGGTTTIFRTLGRLLNRPALFEPFGFNHLDLASFHGANEAFSLGLPLEESRARWERGVPPHCCDLRPEHFPHEGFGRFMVAHLEAIHDALGAGALWKEIRLLPALPALLGAYEELGLQPRMVLVRCHPFGVLYSYYRMLAVGPARGPYSRHAGDFLQVRIDAYGHRWTVPDLFSKTPANAAEGLVLGALLDLDAIARYEEQYPAQVTSIDLGGDLQVLASSLGERQPEEDLEPLVRVAAWRRDPLFRRWARRVLRSEVQRAVLVACGADQWHEGMATRRQIVTRSLNRFMGGG